MKPYEPRRPPNAERSLAERLYVAQSGLCFWCETPMAFGPYRSRRENGWTREHLVPKASGGRRHDNIVLAHRECNLLRGTLPVPPERFELAKRIMHRARNLK